MLLAHYVSSLENTVALAVRHYMGMIIPKLSERFCIGNCAIFTLPAQFVKTMLLAILLYLCEG